MAMTKMSNAFRNKFHFFGATGMTCEKIKPDDHLAWLEMRKHSIGGSDAGVIMGLNEYRSLYSLFKDKQAPAKESTPSIFAKKGTDLEGFIRVKYVKPYCDEHGYTLLHPEVMFSNEATPWLTANLDGLAVPVEADSKESCMVIEIKYVSPYATDKWYQSDRYANIPPSYYAQVQQYMYLTGATKALVFALFDETWEVEHFLVPRDDMFIADLIMKSKAFYKNHMCTGIAPKPDIRFDKAEVASYAKEATSGPVEPSEELDDLLSQYKNMKNSMKDLQAEVSETQSKITQMLMDGYVPKDSPLKVKLSSRSRTAVDSETLKKNFPAIYKEVLKTSEYPVLTVK